MVGGKKQAAADAGSGSGSAVAEKAAEVIIDGHTIGALATDAEINAVEKAEGFTAGALVTARNEGKIRAAWHVVTVNNTPTGKPAVKAYVRLESLSAQGMSALCKGVMVPAPEAKDGEPKPQAGACDFFNYGFDLDRKAPVRAEIMRSLEGPEKAVKKAVIGALAAEMSVEEIRAFVKGAPKFKGVEGIDKFIDAALASIK